MKSKLYLLGDAPSFSSSSLGPGNDKGGNNELVDQSKRPALNSAGNLKLKQNEHHFKNCKKKLILLVNNLKNQPNPTLL